MFKRLFVLPLLQGNGLGRTLIQMRFDLARRMGLTEVYADTLLKSTSTQALYLNTGIERADRYPESHTATHCPQIVPEMISDRIAFQE